MRIFTPFTELAKTRIDRSSREEAERYSEEIFDLIDREIEKLRDEDCEQGQE